MASQRAILARFRRLCLALPDTHEKSSWGHPNFRAGKRIFAVYEVYKGRPAFAFQLSHPDQQALLGDPRFYRTPYTGHRGWISLWVDVTVDWALVSGLVERSYQASRALDGRAEGQAIRPRRARKTTRKKRAARKRSPGTRA
jgi:predicted DNA-binding protein (MmcQ/YjbR family)